MYRGTRVAVVVPAYDVADRIASTVAGVPAFVDHVIVVDDGSRDATAARAAATGRRGLDVVSHETNRGVGAAIANAVYDAVGVRIMTDPVTAERVLEALQGR